MAKVVDQGTGRGGVVVALGLATGGKSEGDDQECGKSALHGGASVNEKSESK